MNIVTPGIRLKNAGLSKNAIHKQSRQDQGQQRFTPQQQSHGI
jgi:hypothetical protein